MPKFGDDDLLGAQPLQPAARTHVIGEPLDSLSIEEIDERIGLLRAEIDRLQTQRLTKEASRQAADAFFKR
jgi:uncharacterized small protein (DUF1192 family)